MDDKATALVNALVAHLSTQEAELASGRPLTDVLATVLAGADIAVITSKQYSRAVRYFEDFLERPALASDLTEDCVSHWLAWLQSERGQQPKTVRNNRRAICRIWNELAANGEAKPYVLRRIRQPKEASKPVSAWTQTQVEQLLLAAEQMTGETREGIPANKLLTAWILVAYDTGFRPGDLRRFTWKNVSFEHRTLTIAQNKTGNVHTASLSLPAVNALKHIAYPERERVLPVTKWSLRRWELLLYRRAADFGFVRDAGQGLGTLRKSHATGVFTLHGLESAAQSLGHVGGSGTARRHYVDSSASHVAKLPTAVRLPSPVPYATDAQIAAAVDLLNRHQQLIYRMRFREGMDARAIADVLAVSRQDIVEALADIASTLRELID